jgi:16S rRNA (guanine966-N2)-methyltransferase
VSLRLTGGEHASRRIRGPKKGQALRPTPDALRERAFAILRPRLAGARVLDLYAGTGINGLEALSRGAASVLAIELDRRALELIRGNAVAVLGAGHPGFSLRRESAGAAHVRLRRLKERFDLIWIDPPFTVWEQEIRALEGLVDLLDSDGILALEAPAKSDLETAAEILGGTLDRRLACGDCHLALISAPSSSPKASSDATVLD